MALIPHIPTDDWPALRRALKKLASIRLGPGSSPGFVDLTLSSPSNIYNLSHDSFADFVVNEHIDHSSVSISAGGILSGGGDITASRTITLAHSDVDHDQLANTHQDVKTTASPTFAGLTLTGNLVLDTKDISTDTTTGTKIATSATQKLGFFGATPVVQQSYTTVSDPPTQAEVAAIRDALINLGLMASS